MQLKCKTGFIVQSIIIEMFNYSHVHLVNVFLHISYVATNGRHQWVPKDIIDAAEKHAKVC